MAAEITPERLAVFERLCEGLAGDPRVVGDPERLRNATPEECWAATAALFDLTYEMLESLPPELQQRLRLQDDPPDELLAALACHAPR